MLSISANKESQTNKAEIKKPVEKLPPPQTVIQEILLTYPEPIGNIRVKISPEKKFLFHNQGNVFIGQLSIHDIVNYIIKKSPDAVIPEDTSVKMIELTLGKKANNIFQLNEKSPFLNDIDLLMILNKLLKQFEEMEIHNFVKCESDLNIIQKFLYELTEHTLDVIQIISQHIKNGENELLKKKLMRYSVGLVYHLTQHLNARITTTINQMEKINGSLHELETLEKNIELKLNE